MAKVRAKQDEVMTEVFFDKTNMNWYVSKKENRVTLCESIDDIISGNGETHEFSKRVESVRTFTKDEKSVEKNYFVLFFLANGDTLLLKKHNEMK